MSIVHIEPMSPTSQPTVPFPAAILSVATGDVNGNQSISAAGEPILAHQITALRRAGISKFLIEVESVSGSLLAMADRLIQSGCEVNFVRSIQDVLGKLGNSDMVIVQAEGIYVAQDLLLELLRQNGAIIVTVDGRDENKAFERMDLNTRWAGMVIAPVTTVAGIGELPDGWSMTSSLLRQAMQDKVVQHSLKQTELQNGRLRRIVSAADAENLATELMAERAGSEPGLIETQLFTPLAAKVASALWHVKARSTYSDTVTMLLCFASVGLAGVGWIGSAAGASIVGIFANSVRLALGNEQSDIGPSRLISPLMWLILGMALIWAAGTDAYQTSDGVFTGGVVVGLAVLARHLRLPEWARKGLQSPALIAFLLLLIAPMGGSYAAAKLIGALQLCLLIVAKWNHKAHA